MPRAIERKVSKLIDPHINLQAHPEVAAQVPLTAPPDTGSGNKYLAAGHRVAPGSIPQSGQFLLLPSLIPSLSLAFDPVGTANPIS